jgi:DNA repair protein RadC
MNHDLYQFNEIKVSYTSKIPTSERMKVTKAEDSYEVFKKVWDMDTIELFEECKIMMLDRGNRVIGIFNCSKGGMSGTAVDKKMIFVTALKANASSIIVGHNHPSGQLVASHADKSLTREMVEYGRFLDIPLLDHLIVTRHGFYSMCDHGDM